MRGRERKSDGGEGEREGGGERSVATGLPSSILLINNLFYATS